MNDNSESAASVVEFGVGHELPGDVVWSSETQDEPPSVPSVSKKHIKKKYNSKSAKLFTLAEARGAEVRYTYEKQNYTLKRAIFQQLYQLGSKSIRVR